MRLADAELLPFDFDNFADTSTEVHEGARKAAFGQAGGNPRAQSGTRRRSVQGEIRSQAAEGRTGPGGGSAAFEFCAHAKLLGSFTHSAERYQKALAQKQASLTDAQTEWLRGLNTQLMESERKLTNEDGLPRRSWYKHLLYAPGVYTGYGVKTVPGVREGIEQKKYSEADAEIVRVAKVLQEEAQLVDSAAQMLEK